MQNKFKVTAKNSAIYGLGNLFGKLVGLVLLPLYTRQFSIDQYGVIGMLEITSQLLVAVFGMNLYTAFFRWYWDKEYLGKQKSNYFTTTVFIVLLSVSLVSILILFRSKLSVLILSDAGYSKILCLSFIASGLDAVGVMPSTLLRLQGRAFQYTYSYLIRMVVNLSLNILFIVHFKLGLESIYYSAIISSLVFLLMLARHSWMNMEFIFEKEVLKGMIVFSVPLLLSAVAGIILTITDRYMLRFLIGLDDVGTYTLSYKIANTIRFLLIIPVNLAVLPVFFRIMDDPDSKVFYARFTTYFSFVTIYAVLAMALFSETVVKLFADNSDYWGSIKLVPVLSVAIFFGMLKDMMMTGLHIRKKTKILATVIILLALFNVLLNYLLIPVLRDLGASYATLITQVLYFIILYFVAQKVINIPYELGRIAKLLILILLIFALVRFLPVPDGAPDIIMRIIIFLIFPFLLIPLKFYKISEIKAFIGFIKKWKNLGNLKQNLSDLLKIPGDD
jgi:O-antigen/teichoic acid export membrane protein